MEASTLTHASTRAGLLGRRSPLLKLQGDERLVALIRAGNDHAFEVLFERYHSRLLAFCRHMLRSAEDAEDVLQEVFVKAHAAMLADERPINVRPWLYRISRNRCLNHLRRPVPEGQDSMDVMVGEGGVTTAERVQKREDFRALVADVQDLPETQRTALLLREIDALSYEEIAETMDTTVPAVKSLLVRARVSLAEATQSRQLTCGEVQLELAEAAEGLRKASGPIRHHVKRCEPCREFRGELRSNAKALAALAPIGPLALAFKALIAKLGWGGSGSAAGGSAAGSGAAASGTAVAGAGAGGAAAGSGVAAAGAGAGSAALGAGAAAAGGGAAGAAFGGAAAAGGLTSAIGAKAAATAATAALLTAGAVEVRHITSADRPAEAAKPAAAAVVSRTTERGSGTAQPNGGVRADQSTKSAAPQEPKVVEATPAAAAPAIPADTPADDPATPADPPADDPTQDGVVGPAAGGTGADDNAGASDSGTATVALVTETATPAAPPTAEAPPVIATPTPPPATDPPPPPADPPPVTDPPVDPTTPPAGPPPTGPTDPPVDPATP
jgi:RNA polymerase sigma factor (sigma-70 family)